MPPPRLVILLVAGASNFVTMYIYIIINKVQFSSVHYRVMEEHLGSLESTQEARVALGCRLGQLLRFFRALQTSRVLHNSIAHAKA